MNVSRRPFKVSKFHGQLRNDPSRVHMMVSQLLSRHAPELIFTTCDASCTRDCSPIEVRNPDSGWIKRRDSFTHSNGSKYLFVPVQRSIAKTSGFLTMVTQ